MPNPLRRRLTTGLAAAGAVALLAAMAPLAISATPAAADTSVTINRISGADRYDTAAKLAEAAYATSSTVVMANGLEPADALAGAYLAAYYHAPILLTDLNSIPDETMTALGQLQVTTVYVLGGTDAISADEFTQLENMTSSAPGGDKLQVIRVAGTDRFATAEAINTTPPASNVGEVNGLKTALVANGYTFPDALAGGAVAAGAALPTITTDPDSLSTAAAQTLTALGIKQVYILGGTDAVTQAVQNQISGMGITTNRLAGPTRTATALAIANFAAQNLGFTAAGGCTTDPVTGQKGCAFSAIDVARGDDAGGGIDALALAPLAGKTRTPILLTGDVDDPSPDTYGEIGLSAQIGTLKAVNIIGGPVAISPGDQTFLTVAAGGGEHPTYTTSATTAAAGASVTAQSGLNICPGSSVGNQGYLTTALIPVNNGTVTGVETTFPPTTTQLAGGAWTDVVTIPSTATAGTTYQLVIACAVSFTGDPTIYGIEGYAPAVITVG